MKLSDRMSNVANGVFIVVALVLGGSVVRQQFWPIRSAAQSLGQPRHVEQWRQLAESGHRMGPSDAAVTILEFADFECPACRMFAIGALKAVRAEYAGKVSVVFRNLPLPYHRFAYPAARAAECAAAQGRFEAFHDLIYSNQDSLGLKPFTAFAHDAGVSDLAQFSVCNNSAMPVATIDADIAAAKAMGATGTPAILINGTLLPGAPDSAQLVGFIKKELNASGKGN